MGSMRSSPRYSRQPGDEDADEHESRTHEEPQEREAPVMGMEHMREQLTGDDVQQQPDGECHHE